MKKQIVINDTEYRNQLADAESEFADERACKFSSGFRLIPIDSKAKTDNFSQRQDDR